MSSNSNGDGIVSFKLVDIATEQFASFPDNYTHDEEEIAIEFGTAFKIDASQHIVGVFTKFEFLQREELILLLECSCSFVLADTFWNAQKENDQIVLPEAFLTHLLVLTVGTARGIIHAKKPKALTGIILPTLNVTQVVDEDITFALHNDSEE